MTVPRRLRLAIAFVVGPLAPGILFALPQFAASSASVFPIWYIKIAALFGYTTAVVFGIPTFWLLNRYRRVRARHYLGCGFLLGVCACLLAFIPGAFDDPATAVFGAVAAWPLLIVSGICGSIAGLAFWTIARPDRP